MIDEDRDYSDDDRDYSDECGELYCHTCLNDLDSVDDRRPGGCIACVRCVCGESIADCAELGDCPGRAA